MKNLIKYREGEISFINYIKQRIKKNLNFLAIYEAGPGQGKSYCAIRTAEDLDPDFDPTKQICFDFEEVMKLINSDWFRNKKIKVLIFDEPQISISNRTWQSLTNKLMNQIISTFRHQNIILLFACPYRDFLDSQSMKLLHAVFEVQGVNHAKKLVSVKPKLLQYNSAMKKTYFHPLYILKNRVTYPLRIWKVGKPSEETIKIYEERKTEFTSKLNKDVEEQLHKLKTNEVKEEKKILTQKQKEVLDLMETYGTVKKVAERLGITTRSVYQSLKLARKKGYMPKSLEDVAQ